MSIFTPAIILLLAMLIQAFLQLTPSIFVIFYHRARGKFSARRADDLTLYFYLGVEIFTAIIFLALFTLLVILDNLVPTFVLQIFPFCIAGVFFALSIISFFGYFRPSGSSFGSYLAAGRSQSTALFLSRIHARQFYYRAEHIKSRSDAFLLGLLAGLYELGFSAPLYIICSYIALTSGDFEARWIVICYILAAVAPLFSIFAFYKSGHHLAQLQRLKARQKPWLRLLLPLYYLAISILIIIFGVSQNGF